MSLELPEIMELDVSSNQGAKQYRVTHRTKASQPPNVDTIFDVAAQLAALGFFEGAPLLANPAAICEGVNIRIAKENRKTIGSAPRWDWPSTCTFSTRTQQDPAALQAPDPTDRPVRIGFRHEEYTAPVHKDEAGNEVLNSAEDPVRREMRRARTILTLDLTVSSFDLALATEQPAGLKFSRNLADWHPLGPYEGLFGGYFVGAGKGFMAALTPSILFENGTYNIDLHAEVSIDTNMHKDFFWDEGFREVVGGVTRQIYDSRTGAFPSKPVFLNGSGLKLPDGDPPVEKNKQYYKAMDWSVLPF